MIRIRRELLWIWLLALVAKLILAGLIPLAHDEAYYWTWARDLRLGYLDHPPLIAWLFALGLPLENFGHLARSPAVFVGHLSLLPWLILISSWMNAHPKAVRWIGCALIASPFFGLGGLVATPDLPLMAFWSWAVLAAWYLDRTRDLRWAALLGLLLGLGFLAKYQIVVFPLAAAVYLTWTRRWAILSRAHWLWMLGTGLMASSPVLIWNHYNDWISFRFQLNHGLSGGGFQFSWPLEYILGQIALLSPALVGLVVSVRPSLIRDDMRFLASMGLTPILFFLLSSFRAPVEANWPLVSQGPLLVASAIVAVQTGRLAWIRAHALVWAGASVLVLSVIANNWTPLSEKALRLHELKRIEAEIDLIQAANVDFTSTYQTASALSYTLRKSGRRVCKLPGLNRKDMFDLRSSCQPSGGGPFRVLFERHEEWDRLIREAGWTPGVSAELSEDFLVVEVSR